MAKTGWEKLKECINNKPIGEYILRSELLKAVYGDTSVKRSTVDTNRRMLVVCGYLSDTFCAGKYTVVKHLEPELTSTKLRNRYDTAVSFWVDPIRWNEKDYSKMCKYV